MKFSVQTHAFTQLSTLVFKAYLSLMTGDKPYTIFLADDDEDDRMFFREALQEISADIDLVTADNGIQLMELLQTGSKHKPAIIFLDLNMPLKNGYECLAEIRVQPSWDPLPVVIMSTALRPEGVEYVHKHGASLYIVKPNEFGQLKRFIGQVLALHSSGTLRVTSRERFILRT